MAVIELSKFREEKMPHSAGMARCMSCKHEHAAVVPAGTMFFSCPECGLEKATFIGPHVAQDGDSVWQCHCGSQMFYITSAKGVVCHSCGIPAEGWF